MIVDVQFKFLSHRNNLKKWKKYVKCILKIFMYKKNLIINLYERKIKRKESFIPCFVTDFVTVRIGDQRVG